jgi:nicotinamide phosphoribosyltransferase
MWGAPATPAWEAGAAALENVILLTDSYKVSHYKQYPPDTEYVYSYFESRGGKFDEVCFFGLQYFVKRYLCGPVVTRALIDQAKEVLDNHMGPGHFNAEGWEHILSAHGGRLPISIKAVPEGTVVPTKNVLFTMVNTDPKCFWLTNYLETLLVEVWYPMTVCTQSREQKRILQTAFKKTGCEINAGLNFKLHDFGYRGVSSVESAALGGAAHLVNFWGTDTMAALVCVKHYYHGGSVPLPTDPSIMLPVAGLSIPAAEHSTITSWGREGELDAFRNMLDQYPEGLVAVVSDSYDVFNACTKLWGSDLKEKIKNRKGTLVVRPDSGDPPVIVPQLLDLLGEAFKEDVTTTSTGHKMLPPYIRMIQGDGISYESLGTILEAMADKGWAADNLAFGSGGALLQKINRDTQKCAFKCSEISKKGGATTQVFKDPITDKGKQSKKGRLTLEKGADGKLTTITEGKGRPELDMLVEVFRDGALTREYTFDEVRATAHLPAPSEPVDASASTSPSMVVVSADGQQQREGEREAGPGARPEKEEPPPRSSAAGCCVLQ